MSLMTAAKEMHEFISDLAKLLDDTKKRESELRGNIEARKQILESAADGIDFDKVALAKTIVYVVGTYAKAGTDRASVVADAVKQLSTGEPIRTLYGDLWHYYFATKSYDHWHGQRSDHPYGTGPRHGSTIFQVGLTEYTRKTSSYNDLSPDKIEAAIYYLLNIDRVQSAERRAREFAAA